MALTIAIEGKGVITDAESTTDWGVVGSGGISPVLETDLVLQGTYAVSCKVSGAKDAWLYYDIGATNELDFSGSGTEEDQLIYLWVNLTTIGIIDTLANNGFRIQIGSSTSNFSYWTIGGLGVLGNDYTGGWMCVVIDPTLTATGVGGTGLDTASARYFGMYIGTTAAAKGENLIIDTIAVGSGLRITGTDVTGWQEVSDYCNDYTNRAWGMLQEKLGIYFAYGTLFVGDSTQTAVTSMTDGSRVFRFGDFEYYTGSVWASAIPNGFNGLTVEDAASYTTTFQDGVLVGSDAGRSGSLFIGSSDCDTTFDLYGGSAADSLTLVYGTTFQGIDGGVTFGTDSDHKCFSAAFTECGQIDTGSVEVRNCQFSGYTLDADGALLWGASTDVERSAFIGNTDVTNDPHAVDHPTAGSYDYTDLTFSGNDYDINNGSSATEVDSYPDTNRDTAVQLYSGATTRISQSFVATAGKLSRAIFSLQKVLAPTGNMVAKLYADTGGSGPGTLLATSEVVDITGIGTSWAQVDFEFKDEYTLVVSTTYWISVEYSGGDASNHLEVGVDNSSPTHSGSCYTYNGSWSSQTYDMCFYVNRNGIVIINATDSNPGTYEHTAAVKGTTIIKNTVALTITCKNTSGLAIEGVRVRIEKTSDGSLISEGTTNSSGIYTDSSYNYLGDVAVNVISRLKGYKNNGASSTIESGGLSVPFTMIRDPAVYLP